jgi:pimeloyl-ACP methyl ester carboxylesterase
MPDAQTLILFIVVITIGLVIGNVIFQAIAERRNPPIGRFVQCDGIRLHYIDRGDNRAPCVVVLHGNGTMIQDFTISGLVDRLARHSRVVCFDRPGFGHSPRPRSRIWTPAAQAELLVIALQQLGVRDPVVFGHSWGTLVALALALRKDYPIRGLVLASGYYFPTARLDFWMLSGPAVPIFGDVLRYTVAPLVSWAMLPNILRTLFAPRPVPAEFRNEFPKSMTLRPKQLRAAAEESALLIPSATKLQSQYPEIDCPVHIFHGKDDELIEFDQSKRLNGKITRSALDLIPGAGHMVTYQDDNRICRTIEVLLANASNSATYV